VPTLHGRPRALVVDLRGHWTGRALLAGPFREAMCNVPVGRATVRACPRRRAGQRKRNPDGGQVESHESGRVCESQSHHHPGRACPDSLLPASHRHQTREGGERERRGGKRTDPASDAEHAVSQWSPTTSRPALTRRLAASATYVPHASRLGVHPNTTSLFVGLVSRPARMFYRKLCILENGPTQVSHVPTSHRRSQ
jgi:hypothetical protein